eukprot:scaffold1486_cov314-Pavlova_lutheri.AAC.6
MGSVEEEQCRISTRRAVLQLTAEDKHGRVAVPGLDPTGRMTTTGTRRCVENAGLHPVPAVHVEEVRVVEIGDRMGLPTTPNDQVRAVVRGNCGVTCARSWKIATCLGLVPGPCLCVQIIHLPERFGSPVATENHNLPVGHRSGRVVGPGLGWCTSYERLEPAVHPRIQYVDIVCPLPITLDTSKHDHVSIGQGSRRVSTSGRRSCSRSVRGKPEIGFAIVHDAIVVMDGGTSLLARAFTTEE